MLRFHVEHGPYRFNIAAADRQAAEVELAARLERLGIVHPGPTTWKALNVSTELEHLVSRPDALVIVWARSRDRASIRFEELADEALAAGFIVRIRAGYREIIHAAGGRLRVLDVRTNRHGLHPTYEAHA